MINKHQSVQDSDTKERRRHNSSDNSNTEMSTEESNIPITSLNKSKNGSILEAFFDLLTDVVGVLDSSVDISVLLLSDELCLGRFIVLESCTL